MNIRKRTWTWKDKTHQAYQLDWRDNGGRHQQQFPTRQEAELYRDKLIRERYARDYGVLLESTFPDFLKIYEARKSWRTESYRERVMSALGLMPFQAFPAAEAIETYRDVRLTKVSPSTVRQDMAALSDCLKWAVKLKYLGSNPAKEVERPSLPIKQDDPARYIPREEFEKLAARAGQDRPLFEFAVWTGLRITELIILEWTDIRDGFVLVRRGKGRKQRLVPLLPQAQAALKAVPRRVKDPRVFWWMRDRHTTLRRFQRRCTWAGIGSYRFHDLRHTFGSYAAMAGVDLEVIADSMGHSSVTVTKLYAHLSPAYKRAELMKMARTVTRKQQQLRKHAKR